MLLKKPLLLFSLNCIKKNIELTIEADNEFITVYGIENELSQVVINIAFKCEEALVNIPNPHINIVLKSNSSEVVFNILLIMAMELKI